MEFVLNGYKRKRMKNDSCSIKTHREALGWYKCIAGRTTEKNRKGTLSSRISSINLASHQRHPTISTWARVTRSKPKRGRIRLLETANTKLLMATARTRNSQLWTLLEVVPLKQLMRPLMMEELVTLDGANSSDNCVNTRYTSATVSCRSGTLSTPQARTVGFVSARSILEEHGRRINFDDSWAHSSTQWYWVRLGGWLERTISTIMQIQGKVRWLHCATSVRCQPQAWELGCDSAQKL